MFWPQVVRGAAIMFSLLPPPRLALGDLPETEIADASGRFNLMRNLGGASGSALIDTILYGRVGVYAESFRHRLLAGDVGAADAIGLSPSLLLNRSGPPTDAEIAFVRPKKKQTTKTHNNNKTKTTLAAIAIIGLLLVPFARDAR